MLNKQYYLLLMTWKRKNASDVIVFTGLLFFGKVPHHMQTKLVVLRHDIEQKRVRVIIQSLVIKKQLGYQTQILGIVLVFATVNFKN